MSGIRQFFSRIGEGIAAPFRDLRRRFYTRHDAALEKKIRREFEVTVSHELRTPLTVILGYSEILLDNIEHPEQCSKEDNAQAALAIHRKSKDLLRFIDNTILITTLDFHSQVFSSSAADVGRAVSNTVEEWKKFFIVPGEAELSLNVSKGMVFDMHERLLRVLVFELLANSYLYRKPGEVCRIDVTLSRESKGFALTVADNGIGIKEKYLDRIFDKFFRIEDRDTAATSGLGIGLTLVKRIADFYHGSVTLQSVYRTGTTVTIRLPVQEHVS